MLNQHFNKINELQLQIVSQERKVGQEDLMKMY